MGLVMRVFNVTKLHNNMDGGAKMFERILDFSSVCLWTSGDPCSVVGGTLRCCSVATKIRGAPLFLLKATLNIHLRTRK